MSGAMSVVQTVGLVSVLISLLCLAGVESLIFLEEPTDTSVYVREKTTLTCRVDKLLDHYSIVWVKDNTQIAFNNFKQHNAIISPYEVVFDRGEGLCSIEIQHAEVSDSGFYICGVEYGSGQYKWSSRATLTVYEFFKTEPTDIGIYEGGTAILPCTANILRTGLSLLWMKGSETLTFEDFISHGQFGRIEIIGNYTNGFYNISIINVTLNDIGSYRCGLQLESGTTEWSREGMMTVLKRVVPVRNDISARPGDEIELTCQAAPFVQNQNLVWEKDMTMITWNEFVLHVNDDLSRLSVEMKDYSYDLQLMLVENTDSGLYRCGVEFPNGLYHWLTEVLLTVMAVSSGTTSPVDVSTTASQTMTVQEDRTTTGAAKTTDQTLVVTQSVSRRPTSDRHSTLSRKLTTSVNGFSQVPTMIGTEQNVMSQSRAATLPEKTSKSLTRSMNTNSMSSQQTRAPARQTLEDDDSWVNIAAIAIITLAFAAMLVICITIVLRRNHERRKKKSRAHSLPVHQESLEGLSSRLVESGNENPYFIERNEMTDLSKEDQTRTQNHHHGEERENHTTVEVVADVDDLYSKPDLSLKRVKKTSTNDDQFESSAAENIQLNIGADEDAESEKPEIPERGESLLDDSESDTTSLVLSQEENLSCEDNTMAGNQQKDEVILLNETPERTKF